MDSQEDIFATQDEKKSKVNYAFLVLCDKNEDVMYPFAWYPRSMFSSSEIMDRWLHSILDHSSRLKSLNTLERVPDKSLSLFGKIEEGIYYDLIAASPPRSTFIYIAGVSREQLDAKVNSLNVQYNSLRSGGETQTSSLLSLVQKNPYRMLSKAAKKV